jgi:hypothetical protein
MFEIIKQFGRDDHRSFSFIHRGQSIIGRVKASPILKELKKEGIVVPHQSAKNKRDIKLFLNDDNPFISLPNELKEFKQFFYPLVDSVTKVPIVYPDSFKVLFECFAIFRIDAYVKL